MLSKSQTGAKASANLYRLIGTTKANNLNVYGYLQCVFSTLLNTQSIGDVEALLPWNVSLWLV